MSSIDEKTENVRPLTMEKKEEYININEEVIKKNHTTVQKFCKNGNDVNVFSENHDISPAMQAFSVGDCKMLDILLRHCAKMPNGWGQIIENKIIFCNDKRGIPILWVLNKPWVYENHQNRIIKCLELMEEHNQVDYDVCDNDGNTVLMLCIKNHLFVLFEYLISKVADLNIVNNKGETLLEVIISATTHYSFPEDIYGDYGGSQIRTLTMAERAVFGEVPNSCRDRALKCMVSDHKINIQKAISLANKYNDPEMVKFFNEESLLRRIRKHKRNVLLRIKKKRRRRRR